MNWKSLKILILTFMLIIIAGSVNAAMRDGILVYYDFEEESGELLDKSGNKINSSENNIFSKVGNGLVGNAWDFESSQLNYVKLQNNSFGSIRSDNSSSVSYWVYPESLGTTNTHFYVGVDAGSCTAHNMGNDQTTVFHVGFNGCGNVVVSYVLPLNTWTHMAYTYNTTNNNLSLFVNGDIVGQVVSSSFDVTDFINVTLGSTKATFGFFDGLMDEFGLWNRSLTSTEVKSLGQESVCIGNPCDFITPGRLNISAEEFYTQTDISNFTAVVSNSSLDYYQSISTTNGRASFAIFYNATYSITVTNSNYEPAQANFSYLLPFQNTTLILYRNNTVFVRIFDENTNSLIIKNLSLAFTAPTVPIQYNFTTDNGTLFKSGLVSSLYTLTISDPSSVYGSRNFLVNLPQASHVSLDAYLLNSSLTSSVAFFVRDPFDKLIDGATLLVTTQVNNSFVTVSQGVTDFTGGISFLLSSSKSYTIQVSAPGLNTRTVSIIPTASTYTIYMKETGVIEFTRLFDLIDYSIQPSGGVVAAGLLNISLVVTSSTSILEWFSVSINNSGGTISGFSNVTTSPGGGTALVGLNLANRTGNSFIGVFKIKAQGYDVFTVNQSYFVGAVASTANTGSFGDVLNRAKNDFSELMRVIIVTFCAGIFAYLLHKVGSPAIANGFGGLVVFTFFAYYGWINPFLVTIMWLVAIVTYMAMVKGDG